MKRPARGSSPAGTPGPPCPSRALDGKGAATSGKVPRRAWNTEEGRARKGTEARKKRGARMASVKHKGRSIREGTLEGEGPFPALGAPLALLASVAVMPTTS